MVHRQILAFLEGDSIEPGSGKEHSILQHSIEREIGLELVFIEIVFGLSETFRVVLPVPGSQPEAAVLMVDEGLHLCGLGGGLSHSGRNQLADQTDGSVRSPGHLVVQGVPGKRWEAQQVCSLDA